MDSETEIRSKDFLKFSARIKLPKFKMIFHEDPRLGENFKTRPCPVCKFTCVQLYAINYTEKFLMCGNVDCPYPFGMANFHIFKIRPEDGEEFGSTIGEGTDTMPSLTESSDEEDVDVDGATGYSGPTEVDKLVKELEEMETNSETAAEDKEIDNEERLRRDLEIINELNKELFPPEEYDEKTNERCIKYMAEMQKKTGIQLLTKDELEKLAMMERRDANVAKAKAADLQIPDKMQTKGVGSEKHPESLFGNGNCSSYASHVEDV